MQHAYQIQEQAHTEWCWAAVGASINNYFSPEAPITQCQLANHVLGVDDCCNDPFPNDRDSTATLQDVLGKLQLLQEPPEPPLSPQDIYTQIVTNSFPIGCRIGWFGHNDNGHFVVICGCPVTASGDQWLDIADPFYGYSTVPYDEFVNSYLSAGEWTNAFLLKQPA
jgi:hypothetical protein